MAQVKCPSCGKKISDSDRFCHYCGAEIVNIKQRYSDYSNDPLYSNKDLDERKIEIEKLRKENAKREAKALKKANKKDLREKAFVFTIISFVFVLAGLIFMFACPLAATTTANWLLGERFAEISSNLFDGMVREFFTFIFWLVFVVVIFVGFLIAFVVLSFGGLLLLATGLVFAIIQFVLNKKWWTTATFILNIIVFLCGIALYLIGLFA